MADASTKTTTAGAATAPVITDAPERQRFEAHLDDALAGFLEYEIRRDRIILVHTEVAAPFEGRGIAGAITRFALEDAHRRDLRVTPACPYVKSYLARHPEAKALLGRPT